MFCSIASLRSCTPCRFAHLSCAYAGATLSTITVSFCQMSYRITLQTRKNRKHCRYTCLQPSPAPLRPLNFRKSVKLFNCRFAEQWHRQYPLWYFLTFWASLSFTKSLEMQTEGMHIDQLAFGWARMSPYSPRHRCISKRKRDLTLQLQPRHGAQNQLNAVHKRIVSREHCRESVVVPCRTVHVLNDW